MDVMSVWYFLTKYSRKSRLKILLYVLGGFLLCFLLLSLLGEGEWNNAS